MIGWWLRADRILAFFVDVLCSLLLLALTLVVLYAVVLRYVFSQPPFWSDIVSMFANVAMILLGLGLAVRGRELIAMQALYERLSPLIALVLDALWNLVILVFAMLFTWYGYEAAMAVPGFYWELNMLPQRYPMMIVPVSGTLLILACLRILIEDAQKIVMLRGQRRA